MDIPVAGPVENRVVLNKVLERKLALVIIIVAIDDAYQEAKVKVTRDAEHGLQSVSYGLAVPLGGCAP